MADQLSLYNEALLVCGERFLATLTENREPRRLLDHVWSTGGVLYCLERGQWPFATRTQQIDYDSSVEPAFGYSHAFVKPDDWVNTRAVCSDEYFQSPLTAYVDEAAYWYADLETIYVRIISKDAGYGLNMAGWSQTFLECAGAHFASKIILKLSNSLEEVERCEKLRDKKLNEAKNVAAQADPTAFPTPGSWTKSRNRFPNRRDGGNSSGSLIG